MLPQYPTHHYIASAKPPRYIANTASTQLINASTPTQPALILPVKEIPLRKKGYFIYHRTTSPKAFFGANKYILKFLKFYDIVAFAVKILAKIY